MSETSVRGRVPDHEHGSGPPLAESGTIRDRVWDATLALLRDRPLPFQAWRVRKRAALDESHDRTIRRTLTVMAEAGWLEHEDGAKWWYPGEKAKIFYEQSR